MENLISEAIRFGWALLGQWAALLTGGIIIAALSVWQWFKGPVHRGLYVGVLTVTFVFACFLNWRDQEKTITALEQQLEKPITVTFQWANREPFLLLDNGTLWVKVEAKNNSTKDFLCRVDINEIRKRGEANPLYEGNLQLNWEGGQYEFKDNVERTVPAGQARRFNLAIIKGGGNGLSFQNQNFTGKLPSATYEFIIQASYSPCLSDPTKILVEYGGKQVVHFISDPSSR